MKVTLLDAHDRETWDRFCWTSGDAWFWHTTAWRDYALAYRPDDHQQCLPLVVEDGRQVLAVVPLMEAEPARGQHRVRQFSFGGDDCWAPALSPELPPGKRASVLRSLFEHLDELATERQVARASFRVSPLIPRYDGYAPAFLSEAMRAGWTDRSLTTQVLDLSPGQDALLAGMSQNHRRNIRKAERSLGVEIYDQPTITWDRFEDYRLLHKKAAGRSTRPFETFRLMYEWITHGSALLVRVVKPPDTTVSYVYIVAYKDGAYYGSGATDPEHRREPAGHAAHWHAIRWLDARGFRIYEAGLQQFGVLPHDDASGKERDISRFKRGFGGRAVPDFARERFWSADLYRHVMGERTEAYARSLGRTDPAG